MPPTPFLLAIAWLALVLFVALCPTGDDEDDA